MYIYIYIKWEKTKTQKGINSDEEKGVRKAGMKRICGNETSTQQELHHSSQQALSASRVNLLPSSLDSLTPARGTGVPAALCTHLPHTCPPGARQVYASSQAQQHLSTPAQAKQIFAHSSKPLKISWWYVVSVTLSYL